MREEGQAEAAVRNVAEAMPGSYECQPFGTDVDVYKAANGKMFLLLHRMGSGSESGLWAQVKVPPEDVAGLLRNASIAPAWHLSKKHWVRLRLDGTQPVGQALACELVEDSWQAVTGPST